jgi:hypothetical protein
MEEEDKNIIILLDSACVGLCVFGNHPLLDQIIMSQNKALSLARSGIIRFEPEASRVY